MTATSGREVSYDARLLKTDIYRGARVTTHRVRWSVGGRGFRKGFRTAAAAESFRSKLVTALREGQAFDVESGVPIAMVRTEKPRTSWYEFACRYVDLKWAGASPKHRKSIAEALITVTPTMLTAEMDAQTAKIVRSALLNWGFTARRDTKAQPESVTERLRWVARHSRPVSDLAKPDVARAAAEAIATKLDGTRASARTITLKRANVSPALNYAVELGLLDKNPFTEITWKAARPVRAIDRRAVANPGQARALLDAVRGSKRSGPRLVAFFASLYYSALRPEEAVGLRKHWLDIPAEGWGWITLETAAPEVDPHWTDAGQSREERALKHRTRGETRRVPCPPELTAILRAHLSAYGTDGAGRLFRGERDTPLGSATYLRVWDRARRQALTPAQYNSPLARRPYDLRHAAVSTWLNSGVGPAQVAEWAGHSIEVLHRTYAKCLDGHETVALRRIEEGLRQ